VSEWKRIKAKSLPRRSAAKARLRGKVRQGKLLATAKML
jgi:hypothetical protein